MQGELHRALGAALGTAPFETYGSGRTDAGVHALGQVAHVDAGDAPPPATLVARVNDALPADINVLAAERVPPRFHARHSAVARSYLYQIARRRTAFAKPFVWWVREDRSTSTRMQRRRRRARRLRRLPRVHRRRPGGEVDAGAVDDVRSSRDGALILMRVVGSHFLWKMVRRIVGVLVEVGRGGLDPRTRMARLLASTRTCRRSSRRRPPACSSSACSTNAGDARTGRSTPPICSPDAIRRHAATESGSSD